MTKDAEKALSCFLSIARTIAGPLDYEQVLQNFADGLRSLIRHDHLDIVLLHSAGMQICYETGIHTSWSRTENPYQPQEMSPIRDVLGGVSDFILTDNAWSDERFHFEGADDQPIFDNNLRSRIIVPLRVRGNIIGSLAISSHKVNVYDHSLVKIAQGAADLLAAYMFALEKGREARDAAVAESEAKGREETLRIGAQRLTEGMERERQRLGMDIHDQTLADLARLSRRISHFRIDGSFELEELMAIEKELSHCLRDLRGIVEDIKPGILQMFGFNDAIEAHMRRNTEALDPPVHTELIDETGGIVDEFPDDVRTSLYRMAQEAVNNALKHTSASKIQVRLWFEKETLKISIEDDGKGIREKDLLPHSGLESMRTRAALISADLVIRNVEGRHGTDVLISLPLASGALALMPLRNGAI